MIIRSFQIDADFECGNIGDWEQKDENTIEFNIRTDGNSRHYQWFYFRIRGAAGKRIRFRALNAGGASYADGWRVHKPVLSSDQINWTRILETRYDKKVYSFEVKIESDTAFIAYYYPYTTVDLDRFLEPCSTHPAVHRQELTRTLQDRPVHWLRIAQPEALHPIQHSVWIIGRQHPGEPQGTSCATGLISMLLSDDPSALALQKNVVFQIIPDINPDGVALGHHRTNSGGVNLNRAWKDASPDRSPTIFAFEQEIKKWEKAGHPIDLFIDLHSDEIQRSNVVYGMDPSIASEGYERKQNRFLNLWEEENPDFSVEQSLFNPNMDTRLSRQWMFKETGALSYTWEATYHDAPYSPHGNALMTHQRTFELGTALGRALVKYFKLKI